MRPYILGPTSAPRRRQHSTTSTLGILDGGRAGILEATTFEREKNQKKNGDQKNKEEFEENMKTAKYENRHRGQRHQEKNPGKWNYKKYKIN